jgi:hypothetical protein
MPDKIPETKDAKPNRAMRRHPEKLEDEAARPIREEVQQNILKQGADDDISVRAKSSGHGKKTADKWNQ